MADGTDPQAPPHDLKTSIDAHDTGDDAMLPYVPNPPADWTLTHRPDLTDREHHHGLMPALGLMARTSDPRRTIRWTMTPEGGRMEARHDGHVEWGPERTSHRHATALIRRMIVPAR